MNKFSLRGAVATLPAVLLGAALACLAAPAIAAPAGAVPDFDPSAYKLDAARINTVMVLGSPHLSQMAKAFDVAQLRLLNARLVAWQPQAVAIEALSGLQCDYLRRYPQRYSDVSDSYCRRSIAANAATGRDLVQANAEAEQQLLHWPAAPTPARRRALAATFLAAGEPASAVVQWLRLPVAERRAGDGLEAPLVSMLEALRQRPDESYQVAAQVAADSGLERVFAMDDHTSDLLETDEKAYGAAVSKAWDNPATAQRLATSNALEQQLDTPARVLAMYRAYNGRGQGELAYRSDFGAALAEPSPQRYGRKYVTAWETRNLRMAANIREAMVPAGMRMLVVVGASHKPYLEAYLQQMHDVRIVATDEVLQ